MRTTLVFMLAVGLPIAAGCAPTQRVGQSATVQHGVVRSADRVTLDSAAAQGALVGGTLGLTASRSSSSSARRGRNAIVGASVGAGAAGAGEGDRMGMSYTVDLLDGSTTRIVTDQLEIRPGDCVAVERVRDTANIRRATQSYCDPANSAAVRAVESSARSEAAQCEDAKQELARATTGEEADLATRKIQLLCNG